jgi:hypothetical protein
MRPCPPKMHGPRGCGRLRESLTVVIAMGCVSAMRMRSSLWRVCVACMHAYGQQRRLGQGRVCAQQLCRGSLRARAASAALMSLSNAAAAFGRRAALPGAASARPRPAFAFAGVSPHTQSGPMRVALLSYAPKGAPFAASRRAVLLHGSPLAPCARPRRHRAQARACAGDAGPNADNWVPFSANAGTWRGQLVRYNADMSKAAEGPTCVRVEVSEHQAIINLQRDAEVHNLKMCSLWSDLA